MLQERYKQIDKVTEEIKLLKYSYQTKKSYIPISKRLQSLKGGIQCRNTSELSDQRIFPSASILIFNSEKVSIFNVRTRGRSYHYDFLIQ